MHFIVDRFDSVVLTGCTMGDTITTQLRIPVVLRERIEGVRLQGESLNACYCRLMEVGLEGESSPGTDMGSGATDVDKKLRDIMNGISRLEDAVCGTGGGQHTPEPEEEHMVYVDEAEIEEDVVVRTDDDGLPLPPKDHQPHWSPEAMVRWRYERRAYELAMLDLGLWPGDNWQVIDPQTGRDL